MLRRSFLGTMAGSLLAQPSAPKMNVLLVVADDLNTALGCYGHPLVKTPNVDSLARRGVRFDRAYCQVPLCCPSRASFLTGMRPEKTGIWDNDMDIRVQHPDVVTLPQQFRNNGWYSAREGKMFHMNVPMGVGTPDFQDPPSWDHNGSPQGLEDNSPGQLHQLTPKTRRGAAIDWMSVAEAKGQADEDAASRAISLLEQRQGKPWFLGLGFVRPHVPLVAPAKFFDMYPLAKCEPVNNPPGDEEDLSRLFRAIRPDLWNNMDMDEAKQREALRGYYASTSFMDEQLGRVLGALDRMKMRENTIVVFTSDHGWHLGEHTRWQKRSLLEESARVPLIVVDPRTRVSGRSSMALVESVDLYPTLCELAGLPAPAHLEGQSFAPLLRTPKRRWKRAAFTQFRTDGAWGTGVRAPNWHYIEWRSPDGKTVEEELYDSRRDPRQFHNVVADPAYANQREQGRVLLAEGWKGAKA
ncbi:MAG: sulfatase [Bryobacter sp.]|jgi:iduronate 2-sulfatase|nr:sulfatase [Bryobacter sp. CoA8 C33]